jgi:hypothetical protein
MDSFFNSVYKPPKTNYVEAEPIDIEGYIKDTPPPVKAKKSVKLNPVQVQAPVQMQSPLNFRQPGDLSSPEVAGVEKIKGKTEKTATDIAIEKTAKEVTNQTDIMQKSLNMQLGLAGAKFLIDLQNADNAYNNTVGLARLNILQARNQASDALYRGRQAQLDRQLEGYQAGEDALLAMAAQGQDVSGQAVGKVQGSLETVGIFNGMQEQINSMREALGFELEEVAYEYQIDSAAATRQNAKFNAALEFGASFLGMI